MSALKPTESLSEADFAIRKASKTRAKKVKHGSKGEKLVLRTLRADDSYKKAIHASRKNSRLGYDIETLDHDGEKEFHEVKSSAKKNFAASTWYIARKQYEKAMENIGKYFFWFVNSLNTKEPTIRKLSPDQLEFRPGRYQVTVGSDYKPYHDMSLKAGKLLKELKSSYEASRVGSVRDDKTEIEERQLIAQAVLTRKFLAEQMNIEYNHGQVSAKQPYHLKYTNDKGKPVYVDIKVTLGEKQRFSDDYSFRLHVTKNRRQKAMELNSKSDHRREFWYCRLDPENKKLYVRAYDTTGKRFWNSPKNHTEIDYYSFRLKP